MKEHRFQYSHRHAQCQEFLISKQNHHMEQEQHVIHQNNVKIVHARIAGNEKLPSFFFNFCSFTHPFFKKA